jgi:hypothetical protein
MKRYLLIFLLLFCNLVSKSQIIKGEWYGWGNIDFAYDDNNYMFGLEITEKDEIVEGKISIYYMDEHRTFPIVGVFDRQTNTLMISNILVPMHFANLPNFGKIDIDMSFTSKLIDSRSSNQIRGVFVSKEGIGFGINFVLMRPYKEGKDEKIATYDEEPIKTPITNINNLPVPEERKVIITEDIVVDSDSLSIDIYDGSIIDGDTVSVYYNNKPIIEKALLSDKPIHIDLHLDKKSKTHLFVLKAENLGTIPPNTGVMVVYDKTQRKEVHFSNNFKISSGILFSRNQ